MPPTPVRSDPLTVITKSLKKKEKVLLVGFGTFQVSKRAAGEGRNPQNGEKIKIPAANVPRFKASKALKDGELGSLTAASKPA